MIVKPTEKLADLYEADETAWLDAMAESIRKGRLDDLDYAHLAEYLEDMAKRDRREVKSRLTVLAAHVLKWQHQPKKRSRSLAPHNRCGTARVDRIADERHVAKPRGGSSRSSLHRRHRAGSGRDGP